MKDQYRPVVNKYKGKGGKKMDPVTAQKNKFLSKMMGKKRAK